MKNNIKFTINAIILSAVLLFLSTRCGDDESISTNTSAAIRKIVETGTWRVAFFWDTDQDETNNFNGYDFSFEDDGTLVASSSANTYSGIWSVMDSNSNDDSLDDVDFNILFTSSGQFDELSDDWEILEKSPTVIRLVDISGGNGGTDSLTFIRN